MAIEAGDSLGPYQIDAPIGEGGMGVVYRARDTKLGRDVAIKILPEEVAEDPERLARFRREAQVLASLNHPHIAAIHGLEEFEGRPFLVLELVEGEDLSERLKRGPIPLEEALEIARQVAEALEEAHAKGIVHRDLKPGNIRITADGDIKVLDFGLAKAYTGDVGEGAASDLSQSPTMAKTGTQAGMILGTAAYMSPEQARGRALDKRTDIWAFGAVLYEMLTGRALFSEETLSDTLAAVLKTEPDWNHLPSDVPRPLRRLLRRCLAKRPKQRLHDIADARLELEDVVDSASEVTPVDAVAARTPWVATGILALIAVVFATLYFRRESTSAPVLFAEIAPPEGAAFSLDASSPGVPALSPDGTSIAFTVADADGVIRLYLRSLVDGTSRVIEGANDASYPFWSPNSRKVGFFADSALKIVNADGGVVDTVVEAALGKGGSWSANGDIVFTPFSLTPIYRVSDRGGAATAVTSIEASSAYNSHRHPRFLPDGRHFLYLARSREASEQSAIFLGSLDGDASRFLTLAETGATYASGHLVFVRGGRLLAQPFDAERLELTGEPWIVATDVHALRGAGMALFAVSDNGILVYRTGDDMVPANDVQLLDENGNVIRDFDPLDAYAYSLEMGSNLSPDGRYAAISLADTSLGTHDIWLYDLERDVRTRFTFDPAEELFPQWSPDGTQIVFSSSRGDGESFRLYTKEVATETSAKVVFEVPSLYVVAANWSPAGAIAAGVVQKETGADIWVIPMDGSGEPRPFLETEFEEYGALSPDGRFMLIESNESGQQEIYVAPYPGPGRKWRLSRAGGMSPRWLDDGRAIVYQDLDGRVVAADIRLDGGSYETSNVRVLFELGGPGTRRSGWWPSRDGRRFLVAQRPDDPQTPLTLVTNWTELANR